MGYLKKKISAAVVFVLLALIAAYQKLLSPWMGGRCRFAPSCSSYAALSLQKHGVIKGVGKSLWRLLRCQPLCRGGYDPP